MKWMVGTFPRSRIRRSLLRDSSGTGWSCQLSDTCAFGSEPSGLPSRSSRFCEASRERRLARTKASPSPEASLRRRRLKVLADGIAHPSGLRRSAPDVSVAFLAECCPRTGRDGAIRVSHRALASLEATPLHLLFSRHMSSPSGPAAAGRGVIAESPSDALSLPFRQESSPLHATNVQAASR